MVLELQQGHGTRCKQSPWFGRRMGHYRMQGLQSNASRTVMERWDDTRFPQRTNIGVIISEAQLVLRFKSLKTF